MMPNLSILLIVIATILGCSDQGARPAPAPRVETNGSALSAGTPLILSILPVESAGSMYERFLPLKYHLETLLKRPVHIKIAKDYETAISEIGTGEVHLACLDPAAYCEVRAGYKERVVPLVRVAGSRDALSRSVLVTKHGKGIHKAADLRGKRLALGSPKSSFSYLIPLAMLNDVGITIQDFRSVDYLQEEDRVALSVLIGNHDVGAMSESVARKYAQDGLEIIKTSEAIARYVLCASPRLPRDIQKSITEGLLSVREKSSRFIDAGSDRFVSAADRDFDVIRVMIKNLTGKDLIEYRPGTIKVAVLPLYSTITLYDRYEPLMRYLSRHTGYEFKLLVPRDFDDFIAVVKSGAAEFSYQNPFVYAVIDRDVILQPLATTIGEDGRSENGTDRGESYRGVIITRVDSTIKGVEGLKNKRVLITSPRSAGGYLSQKIYLRQRGIDTERDMTLIDGKKQENVILGIYRGEADAGFVRESALVVWKDSVDMKMLRVLARTEPLPNWPFALCRAVDPRLVTTVTRLLIELRDREVLDAAKIGGFRKADRSAFEALKRY